MILKRSIVAVVLAWVLASCASATDFQAGLKAYERGDYEVAMTIWRPLAEQGDASAQFYLGLMYISGEGAKWPPTREDYAESLKWFRLAAEQDHPVAQGFLGRMYYNGEGVIPDFVQAHMWFNLAATRLVPSKFRDWVIENRANVEKLMTPAEMAEAERLAREWEPN